MESNSYTTSSRSASAYKALKYRTGMTDHHISHLLRERSRSALTRYLGFAALSAVLAIAGGLAVWASPQAGALTAVVYVAGLLMAMICGTLMMACLFQSLGTRNRNAYYQDGEIPATPEDIVRLHHLAQADAALKPIVASWIGAQQLIRQRDVDLVDDYIESRDSDRQRAAMAAVVDIENAREPAVQPVGSIELQAA